MEPQSALADRTSRLYPSFSAVNTNRYPSSLLCDAGMQNYAAQGMKSLPVNLAVDSSTNMSTAVAAAVAATVAATGEGLEQDTNHIVSAQMGAEGEIDCFSILHQNQGSQDEQLAEALKAFKLRTSNLKKQHS